ncbi:MAG: histidine phosphatase family protein [Aquabacterium sp.]|nr:histidine phosphatase family protein [Aquabacterium sp.]
MRAWWCAAVMIAMGLTATGQVQAQVQAPLAVPVQAGPADKAPKFVERMATPALLAQLRQGGYVLYMRHGTTDNSRADLVPLGDVRDCSRQRVLDEGGRKLSVQVGRFIRQAGIPVVEVLHSPLCRARDSAQLAFPDQPGGVRQVDVLLYTANLTQAEKQPVLQATRYWLSEPVARGSNRVIVAHAPNLADLIGYFVRPEGTVVVIRPLGQGQFAYVASVPPTLWPTLLSP